MRRIGRGKDKRKSPKRQSETKGEAKKNGAKVKSEEVKARMGKGKVKVKRGEGQRKNMDFRMKKPPIGKTFFANEKNKCAKNTIVTRKIR